MAVLDQLVNPHWPYLPEKIKETGEKSDRIERAWSSVPDDPLNYDFFYHVLEADDLGQEPKDDEGNLIEEFNPKSMSPLRCIAESDDKVPKKLFILWNMLCAFRGCRSIQCWMQFVAIYGHSKFLSISPHPSSSPALNPNPKKEEQPFGGSRFMEVTCFHSLIA